MFNVYVNGKLADKYSRKQNAEAHAEMAIRQGNEANVIEEERKFIKHTCHWPNCNTEVPPALWGCKAHWFKLPPHLRRKIWATYKAGQEITKTPSKEYLEAANEVQQWIKENYVTETI